MRILSALMTPDIPVNHHTLAIWQYIKMLDESPKAC